MNVTAHKRLAAILFSYILLFSAPFLLPEMRFWQLLLMAGLLIGVNSVFLFFGRRKESRRRAVAILALVLAAVCVALLYGWSFSKNRIEKYQALADGEEHNAVGYVSEVLYEKPYGSSYYIKLISVDGEKANVKISLSIPFAGELSPYEEISFSCVFSENEADYDSYLKSKGVVISGTAEDFSVTGTHRRELLSWAENIRAWIGGVRIASFRDRGRSGFPYAQAYGIQTKKECFPFGSYPVFRHDLRLFVLRDKGGDHAGALLSRRAFGRTERFAHFAYFRRDLDSYRSSVFRL